MSKKELGRIAIVGADPGGLTLARILPLKGIEVKVYERETSIDARSREGTLDLYLESGQYALRLADLFDKFQALCRPAGQDTRIVDSAGTIHYEVFDENNSERPEIDRGDSRQILLESLKPNTVAR